MPHGIPKNSPVYLVTMPGGEVLEARSPIRLDGDHAFVRASNANVEWRIDAKDVHTVAPMRWHAIFNKSGHHYASARYMGSKILMHRMLCEGITSGLEVDHISRNSLDNTRANLRPVTAKENHNNQTPQKGTISGYPCVYADGKRWWVLIYDKRDGVASRKFHGMFDSLFDACVKAKKEMEALGRYAPEITVTENLTRTA